MTPHVALFMIPGFQHAGIVEQIADGITGQSWQIESGDNTFVLRIDKPEAARLGLDREAERDIQAVVARAGLTPDAVYHDADRGVSLRRWVEGRAWSPADLLEPANLDRLGRLLRDLHALPPAGPIYEPGTAARRYAMQIDTPAARQLADEANLLLAELRFEPSRECLCHNDLLAENLVDTGERLVPIDWEYAGIGDPLFDLAVIMEHHELPDEACGRLRQAYFRRETRSGEVLRLRSWCRFYRMLLRLWLMRVGDGQTGASVR